MNMKKIYIVLAVFLLIIAVFSVLRAKTDRWNLWGFGDAQELNAAIHYVNEGFLKHFFLPIYNPGYLGLGGWNMSEPGYYTHYHGLPSTILGAGIKIFGENRFLFRCIMIFLSVIGLLFWFRTVSVLFNEKNALIFVIFMGISTSFLDLIDGLCGVSYDEFYLPAAIYFFILADRNKKPFFLLFTWFFTFLQSINTFDYYIFLQVFFAGYFLLLKKESPFPYKKIIFL
ncbi:MAG: hypothetical protein AB1633_05900, partial [Elusimicrobiota bacterium]